MCKIAGDLLSIYPNFTSTDGGCDKMAFLNYEGRVQIQDEHGLKSTKVVTIRIDDAVKTTEAAQLAAAMAAMEGFAAGLDDAIDPVIVSTSLTVPMFPAGLKSSPGDQGAAEGANLSLATVDVDTNAHSRPYWLPGAKAGVFAANFRTVDTSDAELLAFLDSFNPEAGVEITISDGEVVTGINSGVYATRQRNASGL